MGQPRQDGIDGLGQYFGIVEGRAIAEHRTRAQEVIVVVVICIRRLVTSSSFKAFGDRKIHGHTRLGLIQADVDFDTCERAFLGTNPFLRPNAEMSTVQSRLLPFVARHLLYSLPAVAYRLYRMDGTRRRKVDLRNYPLEMLVPLVGS